MIQASRLTKPFLTRIVVQSLHRPSGRTSHQRNRTYASELSRHQIGFFIFSA